MLVVPKSSVDSCDPSTVYDCVSCAACLALIAVGAAAGCFVYGRRHHWTNLTLIVASGAVGLSLPPALSIAHKASKKVGI